jgi:hypothetical protein
VEWVEVLLQHSATVEWVVQLLDMEILEYRALSPLELVLVENQMLLEAMD